MVTVERRLSLEEFLRLPEQKPPLEYDEDGRICQKVSPKLRHGLLQARIAEWINAYCLPRKLAMAFCEPRATFAGVSRVPDVGVLRWDRIPVDEDDFILDDLFAAPDIVIEIVSPGQSVNRQIRRCTWFVQNGVLAALLVDPDDQSVLEFRPGGHPIAYRGDDRIDLSDILPDFGLVAREIFDALRRPRREKPAMRDS